MPKKNRFANFTCRGCGCTNRRPCPPNGTGRTCVQYPTKVQKECAFCTNPKLKAEGRVPRTTKPELPKLVGRTVNKKYVYRTSNAYQVRVPIPELGKDKNGKTMRLSARFMDKRYGGRGGSFKEAVKFRDEALAEYNLSLDGPPREVPSDVNIYWDEKRQGFDVHINAKVANVREFFSVKTWVFKENAYVEARRFRDVTRASLGLPPAPDSLPVLVDFEARRVEIAERAKDEARREIEGYEGNRRLVTSYNNPAFAEAKERMREPVERALPHVEGVTVTKSTREEPKPVATRRWADFALNNKMQMSSGMHGKNRNRGRK